MEARREIILSSNEAKYVLDTIHSGKNKRPIYFEALNKIAQLMKLANGHYIYAYKALIEIRAWSMSLLDELNEGILLFEETVKKKGCDFEKITYREKLKTEIAFYNPHHYLLTEILERFDKLMCLISYTKDIGGFSGQNSFFCMKDKYKKELNGCLSRIIRISPYQLPRVQFDNYFKQDVLYQRATQTHGVIEPQILENAIRSTGTPNLSAKRLNQISYQLKQQLCLNTNG